MVFGSGISKVIEYPPVTAPPAGTNTLFSPSFISIPSDSPHALTPKDTSLGLSGRRTTDHLTPILADSSVKAALEEYSMILNRDTSQLFFPSPFIIFSSVLSPSFRALLSLIHCSRRE